MSTTYVQALPDVRGRMSYTEFGEGKRRRDHLQNGTDRIAAQMGDMPSRGEFIAYCNGLHAVHPNMVNEGYELRVSWALDELNPGNPDDVQRGMEHAYLLCHRLAPDSPCWVTMHVDGEGGCVHAHATIANHDCRTGQVINKDDTSLFAPRVQAVNDELSREWGLSVIGADKDKSTWAEKRDSFDYDSFDRHLGDAVAKARDDASDIDDFKQRLAFAGVTLNETSKVDKKTGEKSVGWSYRMRDEWGPKRRTRKRRASNLADDLTKEGVERFFEEKQGQQTREALETSPVPKQDSQMVGMEDTQQDSPVQHDFDMYEPSESDVKDMASDLKNVYARRRKSEGMPIAGEQYEALANAENDPEDALAQLRADVERARREFRDSKEARDALKGVCPSLAMGFGLYTLASRTGTDPVSRMMSDMMARMFRMMMLQFMEDQRRRMQEDAERRLYESRGNMWDAEKRLKAAEEALDNEAARTVKHRGVTPKMQQTAEATERVRDEDKYLGE